VHPGFPHKTISEVVTNVPESIFRLFNMNPTGLDILQIILDRKRFSTIEVQPKSAKSLQTTPIEFGPVALLFAGL
jgi:hypothetical protein